MHNGGEAGACHGAEATIPGAAALLLPDHGREGVTFRNVYEYIDLIQYTDKVKTFYKHH